MIDPDAPRRATRAESLFDLWDEFRALFVRSGMPPRTIELVRHGFYVGAMAAFVLIVQRRQADETGAEVAARLEALRVEIEGFRYDLGSPRAPIEDLPWTR